MGQSLSDGKLVNDALSAEEFERIAAGCRARWSARTLDVVQAILIRGKTVSAAAAEFGMTPQQAGAARTRFLARVQKASALKLSAERFMQQELPAHRLDAFKGEIKRLARRGYSNAQISAFLRANGVEADGRELADFLEATSK